VADHTARAHTSMPPLVQRAIDLARRHGFEHSCIPEVGRLLGVLASHVHSGAVGEIGTGTGVGAAWMVSHIDVTTRFVTVESDAGRVAAARGLFADRPNVRIVHGDWRVIVEHGPFDLLFVDAGDAKASPDEPVEKAAAAAETILRALRLGGMVVMDDLGPEGYWPEGLRGRPDPLREFWLNDTRVKATEVLTTPRTVAIMATRVE